jgi:hypothetical protein
LSDKTGRSKEEGGHKPIHASISKEVLKLIQERKIQNLSKFIEYCLKTSTFSEYDLKLIKALCDSGNFKLASILASEHLLPNGTVSLKYLERKTE